LVIFLIDSFIPLYDSDIKPKQHKTNRQE